MSGTLRTLLGARAAAVVGRQAERAVLLDLAERDRPLVVAVHGIAGIGKSALLAAFAEDARAHGAVIVSLDCGGIEPTERGFLAALDRAIGALRAEPPGIRPIATVAEAAAVLSDLGDRVVLVLDTYEQLRLLDTCYGRNSCRACATTPGWRWPAASSQSPPGSVISGTCSPSCR
jgi:hypothetical protein